MKILIADDDRICRALLRQILAAEQAHELTEVSDGAQAWTLLDQGMRPDLCILDIMMPNLDGLELLRRIRNDERLKQTNVILCSAVNDRPTVIQAAALSINYFILKPYTSKIVLEQVRKVQQRLNGRRRLENRTAICARLGIDSSTYLTLLKLLTEEVSATVEALELALSDANASADTLRLNALRGAAMNLGANALLAEISRLESELSAHAPSSAVPAPNSPQPPPQASGVAQPQSKAILNGLTALKSENAYLISEMAQIEKQEQGSNLDSSQAA